MDQSCICSLTLRSGWKFIQEPIVMGPRFHKLPIQLPFPQEFPVVQEVIGKLLWKCQSDRWSLKIGRLETASDNWQSALIHIICVMVEPAQAGTITHVRVSQKGGTSKSSSLMGFSIINHPFWGSPTYGNPHVWWYFFTLVSTNG